MALVCTAGMMLGCTKQTSRGPAEWSASNPASPAGQDEDQLWARSTSNDHSPPPPRAPALALPPPEVGGIELPAGAALVATSTVDEVEAFPEEAQRRAGSNQTPTGVSKLAVRGIARIYDSPRPYGESVDFIQHAMSNAGCKDLQQTTTSTTTIWSARCPSGERAHVAIRNTQPTTIEVVETRVRESVPPSGVTNAQPPNPAPR
ncbi:MAG TPA: hypothetical protein VGL81_03905 [Polyangiaceae bacterium]|jgi:hypothetical protein